MPEQSTSFVQYGCGWSAPPDWINFDASPTLRLERLPIVGRLVNKNETAFPPNVRFGDIVRGLPIPDQSCQSLYCSHVLEHLALDEFEFAVRHSFELLRPGGCWRIVLPDLQHQVQTYISDRDPDAAFQFMEASGLGSIRRPRTLMERVQDSFGHSRASMVMGLRIPRIATATLRVCRHSTRRTRVTRDETSTDRRRSRPIGRTLWACSAIGRTSQRILFGPGLGTGKSGDCLLIHRARRAKASELALAATKAPTGAATFGV